MHARAFAKGRVLTCVLCRTGDGATRRKTTRSKQSTPVAWAQASTLRRSWKMMENMTKRYRMCTKHLMAAAVRRHRARLHRCRPCFLATFNKSSSHSACAFVLKLVFRAFSGCIRPHSCCYTSLHAGQSVLLFQSQRDAICR
jgi:hypothetical protein